MLGGLVGDRYAGEFTQLPGPHAGTVNYEFRPDIPLVGPDPGHLTALAEHFPDRRILKNSDAFHPGAFGQRHGDINRIDATIRRGIEASHDTVHISQWKHIFHLAWREFQNIISMHPVKG